MFLIRSICFWEPLLFSLKANVSETNFQLGNWRCLPGLCTVISETSTAFSHPVIGPLLRPDLLRQEWQTQCVPCEDHRRWSTITLCPETLNSLNQTSPDGPKWISVFSNRHHLDVSGSFCHLLRKDEAELDFFLIWSQSSYVSGEVGFLEDGDEASSWDPMTCAIPTAMRTTANIHLIGPIWGFQHFTPKNSFNSHNSGMW